MSAVELIRRVEVLGGRLFVDEDGKLRIQAQEPLPQPLVAEISADKPAIMVALGTPMNTIIHTVLGEIRPFLPESLRRLSDDRLLALVNFSIIAAWHRAIERAGEKAGRR